MSRGEFKVIRDPAVAIGAGKCWIARWGDKQIINGLAISSFHPEDCAFCDLDSTYLIEAIDEFMTWSNLREDDRKEVVPLRPAVESFLSLSPAAQERAVREAQGYEETP